MVYTIQEQTTLAQWGNSKATRIPAEIVKKLSLKDNQKLSISVEGNSIILIPENPKPKTIQELFADWKDDGVRDGELDWGQSKGNELEW